MSPPITGVVPVVRRFRSRPWKRRCRRRARPKAISRASARLHSKRDGDQYLPSPAPPVAAHSRRRPRRRSSSVSDASSPRRSATASCRDCKAGEPLRERPEAGDANSDLPVSMWLGSTAWLVGLVRSLWLRSNGHAPFRRVTELAVETSVLDTVSFGTCISNTWLCSYVLYLVQFVYCSANRPMIAFADPVFSKEAQARQGQSRSPCEACRASIGARSLT